MGVHCPCLGAPGGLDRTVGQAWSLKVGCPMDVPLDRWTGQDSGTSLVGEGGMSNGCPMDVHWTGRTIPSRQRILMANLDMSVIHTLQRYSLFSKLYIHF